MKHQLDAHIMVKVLECYAKFVNLDHLSYEFISCPFTEMEAMVFACGISKMQYLRRLTFRVIQHPHISEECILQFVSVISRVPNLIQFDIYFRRLRITGESMNELIESLLRSNENITCSYFKGSIHISR